MRKYTLFTVLMLCAGFSWAQTFPTNFHKISATSGDLNLTIGTGANFGIMTAGIGDLDNNGVLDIAAGAVSQNGFAIGAVFVLFMKADGTVDHMTEVLSSEAASQPDSFASALTGLGDLDGDGVEDIGVGADYDSDGNYRAGAYWILFMNTDGTVKSRKKISSTTGDFTSLQSEAQFGGGSTKLGDLDGDGVTEIAVGARNDNGSGSVYIMFMNTNGTVKNFTKITTGSGGLPLDGSGLFGYALSSLGDLDGDGTTDLAIGAHRSDIGSADSGVVWIVFLNPNGTVKGYSKISSGYSNFSDATASLFGVAIAGLGDYDSDGYPDMVVGGEDGTGSGALWYVMLNGDGSVKNYYKISATSSNSNISLNSGDFFAGSLANIGDLNSDGVVDIASGAFSADDGGSNSGAVWVSLSSSKLSQNITFAALAPKAPSDPPFTLTATPGASGQPVTFTSSNTNVATVSGSTVTIVGNGSTIITAHQAGNATYNPSPDVPRELVVNKLGQTITFGSLPAKVYGNPAFSPGATASSGLTVSYISNNPAVAQITAGQITITGVGSATITATQAGNVTYAAAPDVQQTLTVSKGSQTITFGVLAAKTFGDAPFNLAASTSSGLAITYTSDNTDVATVTGDEITITGAGSTVITAKQAGNTNYNPATDVPQTLTVNKTNQTITFSTLASKTYGDDAFSLTAESSSGLAITYTSDNTDVATVTGDEITITGAGSTVITAKQTGNANYNPASDVPQTLTVAKANQTVTFGTLASKTYGDIPFTLTATSSSGLAITYTSDNTDVATVTGDEITITGAGSTVITAKQAGNTNYNPATDVPQTLTINKANQTITFGTLASKTYGDDPFSLTATSSSGLAITYSSDNTDVATVTGDEITITGAGSTVITAKQTGNANYNAATDVPQTLTINKANQTITFGTLASKTYGDDPFSLTATSSSSLTITYSSDNTDVATVTGDEITITGAGNAVITAKQAGNANYNAATDVPQTLTVGKADQTITFDVLPTKVYGDSPFTLTATSSSSLTITYSSSNANVATVAGNVITLNSAGSAVITASQTGSANHNAATDVPQVLTVAKASQTITFDVLPAKVYGDVPFALTATSSSGLATTYTSSDASVATVTGSEITINGAGSAVITASQSGNTNYGAASDVSQTLTIGKANQTITFGTVTTKTTGDSPFSLVASSSSSLQVEFSTTSDKVTISGGQLTIVKPGSVSISANQAGNNNYNGATQVSQTFCVNPAKPTVTASNQANGAITLTSSSNTGNQWYLNGSIINGATSASYGATASGTYTVIVTADNCSSTPSSDQAIVITGDLSETASASFIFYPNPVRNLLYVNPVGFGESTLFEVNVHDLQGKQARHHFFRGAEGAVDVESLAAGMYLVEVLQGDVRYRAKFVKE